MCGIAAIFNYGTNADYVSRDELLAMRDHMAARGPDGVGEWISADRRVGLGHRRLSIIDLSPTGAQPMFNEDKSLVIIFNGEIYNYKELRSQLSVNGYQFKSQSDTEVILKLYAERGADVVHALRGMYAFIIWDACKRELFLARDPFGIKPLYYADDGKTIRVASQVKALLAGGHIDTSIDPAGHVGFFLWGAVPDPFTLYRGVSALPAGHTLTISENGKRQLREFCSIPEILRDAESHLQSPRSNLPAPSSKLPAPSSELLHEALHDSAEHHLVADVPVGVFLSAGLDSSTITALVSESHPDVRTVTLGFDEYRGSKNDETHYADVTARNYKTNHEIVWVTRDDFAEERENLFRAMDRPSIDGVNTYFVSLAAKKTGLKVALSGLGGDELFGGYPSFRDVPRLVRLTKHFPTLRRLGGPIRAVSSKLIRKFTSPKYAGIFEYGSSYPAAYLLRRSLFMPWELPAFLDPDLVREGWERLNTFDQLAGLCDSLDSARLKVSAMELCWYMRHQLLRDSDWAGMGHSVEIRVPFVDVDLLKKLAPFLAQPNPPTKHDVVGSLSSKLPAAILRRPKTGFQVPVRQWLMHEVAQVALPDLKSGDRGLRGWAKHVYSQFPGNQLSLRSQRFLPRPAGFRPSGAASGNRRILVYRIGQLGDTIVALPAMRAVRNHFPDAHIELLCDRHEYSQYILAADLLAPMGLFDGFITYEVNKSRRGRRSQFANLTPLLRSKKFDTIVYLAPSQRTTHQILRDRLYFRFVGIRNFFGFRNFRALPKKIRGQLLPTVPSEGDLLLERLATDGIAVPAHHARSIDLDLTDADEHRLEQWLSTCSSDGGRRWLAVGPGCKQPVNEWPLENYAKTIAELVKRFDAWPVIFGGAQDKEAGDFLIESAGRGFNAAGKLDVRAAAAAMRRCAVFVGNDTGTIHLAAAAGIPCVGIYSARQWRGLWDPYTSTKRVLRSDIECEGCMLTDCVELNRECLRRISPEMAVDACAEFLEKVESQKAKVEKTPEAALKS